MAAVEVHDTVAVPDPVILLGIIDPQVRPDGIESVRDTVPVNPLAPVTVIVETACCPTSVFAGEVAAIAKV